MYSLDLETRIDNLLTSRGIAGHTAADRFISDFKAYLAYYDMTTDGSANTTLSLLEDDNNLVSSDVLYTNFSTTFEDLLPIALREDEIFPKLFKVLIDNKGKGVGVGELALPLIIAGYSFSNDSDGILTNGAKVEIKKKGASLKPVKTGLTKKGLVDDLNDKYFNGTVPGMKMKTKFNKHLNEVTDPTVYADYFAELYVGCDTSELAKEVETVYTDKIAFCTAVGKFALKNYKRVDGWNNIMFIDDEKMRLLNIADVDNVEDLGLRFHPVLRRGGDTQAIADGYVNVDF